MKNMPSIKAKTIHVFKVFQDFILLSSNSEKMRWVKGCVETVKNGCGVLDHEILKNKFMNWNIYYAHSDTITLGLTDILFSLIDLLKLKIHGSCMFLYFMLLELYV